jgi:hypothetical protein
MTRSNTCACLAVYDWTGELDTVQFHELAREFFDANGVLPNICGVERPNGSGGNMSYTVMKERLRSEPLPLVDGLTLYHTLPDYAQLVFGWDVTAALECHRRKMMAFCCDQTIRGLDLNYFVGLLERIARIVQLCYGIGYLRSFELGPSIYASGLGIAAGFSDEEMAEADRIGAWFREIIGANRHMRGYLRDVYPLNVISEPHLSQRVGGMPLADWIGQSPQRGTLRSLPGDAWIWRIDESNVDAVRAELVQTGLLIAYPPASK